MNHRNKKTGFTLIEILIATAMIVLIVSIVYGTYSATLRTAQRGKEKAMLAQQAGSLLTCMARQISGVYPFVHSHPAGAERIGNQVIEPVEKPCLIGETPDRSGKILSFVTTSGIGSQASQGGLLRVEYLFDAATGLLSYRQQRWLPSEEALSERGGYLPLARHVKAIELEFFDGKDWCDRWANSEVPAAVKIKVDFQGEFLHPLHLETVVPVPCWNAKETHG